MPPSSIAPRHRSAAAAGALAITDKADEISSPISNNRLSGFHPSRPRATTRVSCRRSDEKSQRLRTDSGNVNRDQDLQSGRERRELSANKDWLSARKVYLAATPGGSVPQVTMNADNPLRSAGLAMCANRLCPLSRLRSGMTARVKQLCASPEMGQRLREIGLGEEQVVRLLSGGVNVICIVCNARLALSTQLAEAILVEPVESGVS